MSEIVSRKGKVDLADITLQAVESIKFVDSWNKQKKGEYTPVSGFTWSTEDTEKLDRFRFKRATDGHTNAAKKKAYIRIFTHIQKRLRKSDKRFSKDDRKLALSTIHAYSGKIRKAIQEGTGAQSLTKDKDIEKLMRDYPIYKEQLERIKQANAVMVGAVKKSVENSIHADKTVLSGKLYNELYKMNFDNEVVRRLGLDASDSKTRKDAIRANRALRKTNAITLSLASIKRIMSECLASKNFDEMALGLALATGRRAIEILHVGNFQKTRGKKNIKFTGQAKASKLQKETPNIIPMLVEADVVIDTVNRLRNMEKMMDTFTLIKDMSESEQNIIINRRFANGLNKTIRRIFGDDRMVFHTSRVIAVKTALAVIYPKQKNRKLDDGEFMARYTGHTLNGKSSYADNASYEHVHIDVNGVDNIVSIKSNKDDNKQRDVTIMDGLLKALEADRLSTKKPFLKWYDSVMKNISIYPFALTQSIVSKGYNHNGQNLRIGGGRVAVRNYFNHPIVKSYIEKYNNS